ncbi:hypothetical protein DL93DRAFT_1633564 [Clavulina sp. PMI_390]|nr:hypothetical protein DL93DRAFT_1633564 [Clavulina sp. PMI_390]
MLGDRISHFLWANVILTVFFAIERRMADSVATAGALAHFAVACGLTLPGNPANGESGSTDPSASGYLLPPPKDKAEEDDRIRLAHAIYIGVQAFPQLWRVPPTYASENLWSPISREPLLKSQDGKVCAILL